MRRVIELTLEQYALAWQPLGTFRDPTSCARRPIRNLPGSPPADDLIIVSSFDIQIDYGRGKMIACVPYASIEPLNEQMMSGIVEGSVDHDTRWTDALSSGVEQASITLNVELGKIEISVGDLVSMRARQRLRDGSARDADGRVGRGAAVSRPLGPARPQDRRAASRSV